MSLQEIYRRSHSVRRIPLKFTTGGSHDSQVGGHMTLFGLLGDVFTSLIDKYLRRGLHKGMHSLFMSIRNLYSDPAKVSVRVHACACACACAVCVCVCVCVCESVNVLLSPQVQIIGDLVTGYVQSLHANNHFFPQGYFTNNPPRPQSPYQPKLLSAILQILGLQNLRQYTCGLSTCVPSTTTRWITL